MIHRKQNTNDYMIKWLLQYYKRIFEDGSGKMSVIRGKIHKHLGMTLDYKFGGQVSITMISYIEEILSAFDKAEPKWGVTKTSAAPNNIFVVNESCKKLN